MSPARLATRRLLKTIGDPGRALRVASGVDDFDFPGTRWIIEQASHYDVVHLHNLHGAYFDLRLLPELCAAAPVVITAHDMWLATGGCAYSLGCERWKVSAGGCGPCPLFEFSMSTKSDKTRKNWSVKQSIYERCQESSGFALAAPAQWALNILQASIAAPAIASSHHIVNGIDTKLYHPQERAAARAELGLPRDVSLIVISAAGFGSRYKDFHNVLDAAPLIAKRVSGLQLLVLGAADALPAIKGVSILAPGFLRDPAELALYLCASDLYIQSSRAEVLPLAVLEAQACGLPVVATNVGGVSEALVNGQTGILVTPSNPAALAEACVAVLSDPLRCKHMGESAAAYVAENFSLEQMTTGYLDLYRSLSRSTR